MLALDEKSYDWAILHALNVGDTNVLPLPFEYKAMQHDWDDLSTFLNELDVTKYITRPHRQILVPKSKYGFRTITQLDPLDFIVYSALVFEVGDDLESSRIATSDRKVFSYRFKPDLETGVMFDKGVNY
jgi:hypothetical protein